MPRSLAAYALEGRRTDEIRTGPLPATIVVSMNFDDLKMDDLRNDGSLKWSLFPDAIGMFVAEMDYGIAPPLRKAIENAAHSSGIGYRSPANLADTRQATAGWYSRNTSWPVSADQVYLIPDVITGARIAIEELTPADSPIIVPTPAYMKFFKLIPELGREVIEVPSLVEGNRYSLNLDGIRDGLVRGAKLVVLVNPWNPTGRVLTREELQGLDSVLAEFPDARIFVDEIHAPLVLEGDFTPYASVSENSARQAVTAIAASKGWNVPGLKCAQLILSNHEDSARLAHTLADLTDCTSTLGSSVAAAAYNDGEEWMESVRDYVRTNARLLEQWAAGTDGVSVTYTEGTYIGWLDFSGARKSGAVPADADLATWIRTEAGVALTSGRDCGSGYDDFVRIVFATSTGILEQALDQISQALGVNAQS